MINSHNLINDGLNSTNPAACVNNDPTLPATVQTIASATLSNLTDSKGILHDACESSCGAEGIQFKGIFLRNLMALNDAFSNPLYKTFVDANANSIWSNSQGPNYEFGQVWSGPYSFGSPGNTGVQTSALDVLVAASEMHQLESISLYIWDIWRKSSAFRPE